MTTASRYLNDLTASQVRTLFDYDPETGIISWKVDRSNGRRVHTHAGDPAGTVRADGYVQIHISGSIYLAHRLIWLWQTGEWPREHIDHINLDPSDNRWANLREATNGENMINSRPKDRLLPRGVHVEKSTGKFRAHI